MRKLYQELQRIRKHRDRLQSQLEGVVTLHGTVVDEATHSDLMTIIQNEGETMQERALPNTFQEVFWRQQVDAASRDDIRGMRWHPTMIKWCIYLWHLSQSAYETLRQSHCLQLPSQRTLRDYTHHIKPSSGYSTEVDDQLYHAAKLNQSEEREKYVLILLDEMYIKEDLVYNKHTRELVGFTNLGEINSHLLVLEQSLSSSDSSNPPLAQSVMALMVRGLFSHLQFPYAHFPCHKGVTGDLLYNLLWEAVYRLERLGFKVRMECG